MRKVSGNMQTSARALARQLRMSSLTSSSVCSSSYYPSSLSLDFKFKFPSNLRRFNKSKAGAKRLEVSCSINKLGQKITCNWNRRRGLLFTATFPFLLPLNEVVEGFDAKAVESGANEYGLIKESVMKVVTKGKAAGVLRLAFHDAGTFEMEKNSGGMNGSIVYELERPENAGLKKSLKVLKKAKSELDTILPVSWADMIATGGAVAVSVCGGPIIPVTLGRVDSMEPDPEGKLPQESLDASGLKQCFQRKGLSARELVALSGAHTLGSKGFGNPTVFDNSYFKILLEKPWKSSAGMSSMIGLPSDHALVEDEECLRWITMYADDQNIFFEDFKNAYIKLVNSGTRWKSL